MRIIKIKLLAVALLSALCALAAPAVAMAAESGEAQLERLKTSLAKVQDLRANFTQATLLEAAGIERESGGVVEFKRGGKMRWEYTGSDPQLIVSDGTVLWVHQVRDHTAIRREMAELSASARTALDLLGGVDNFDAHFNVGGCGERCIELTPKVDDPDLSAVQLILSADGTALAGVVTLDAIGNKTRIELSDVKTNTGIPDGDFNFVVPEDVDVFDGQGRPR